MQKSIPVQIRQLILYRYGYYYKKQVDGFVRELISAKRVYKHFVSDKIMRTESWCRGLPEKEPPVRRLTYHFFDVHNRSCLVVVAV